MGALSTDTDKLWDAMEHLSDSMNHMRDAYDEVDALFSLKKMSTNIRESIRSIGNAIEDEGTKIKDIGNEIGLKICNLEYAERYNIGLAQLIENLRSCWSNLSNLRDYMSDELYDSCSNTLILGHLNAAMHIIYEEKSRITQEINEKMESLRDYMTQEEYNAYTSYITNSDFKSAESILQTVERRAKQDRMYRRARNVSDYMPEYEQCVRDISAGRFESAERMIENAERKLLVSSEQKSLYEELNGLEGYIQNKEYEQCREDILNNNIESALGVVNGANLKRRLDSISSYMSQEDIDKCMDYINKGSLEPAIVIVNKASLKRDLDSVSSYMSQEDIDKCMGYINSGSLQDATAMLNAVKRSLDTKESGSVKPSNPSQHKDNVQKDDSKTLPSDLFTMSVQKAGYGNATEFIYEMGKYINLDTIKQPEVLSMLQQAGLIEEAITLIANSYVSSEMVVSTIIQEKIGGLKTASVEQTNQIVNSIMGEIKSDVQMSIAKLAYYMLKAQYMGVAIQGFSWNTTTLENQNDLSLDYITEANQLAQRIVNET